MEARHFQDEATSAEPEWEVARLFPPRGEWTEEDYLSLPSNYGVELSDGCLEFLPMPSELHQLIVGFLYRTLYAFAETHGLGLVLVAGIPVRLWPEKMREPDVVFLSWEKADRRREKFWDGADLAIEVVSPEGRKRDLETKREEYARAGIAEYWIVDSEKGVVYVLVLDGEAYLTRGEFTGASQVTSTVLPGFSISAEAIFAAAMPRNPKKS